MKEKLNAKNLKGNWATLLLPVNADDTFNYTKLADEIAMLINAGVDGIYANGTAGEFHNQTEEEYDTINSILSEKCLQAGMRFQVGASHPSPIISLNRLKRAVAFKPDAIQVILPDWVIVTDTELINYLKRLAEAAAGVPLVLYNPLHAKRVLQPVDYQLLKQIPEVIGVKLLSRDAEWVEAMKQYASHLSIFVPGHFLASGVTSGIASGAYSNVACINPKAAQNWWAMMQTDITQALKIEQDILAFFARCIAPLQQQGYSNPALDKFLATVSACYNVGTRLRWPYKWIPEEQVAAVREQARQRSLTFSIVHMRFSILFISFFLMMSTNTKAQKSDLFKWGELAPIPDQFGFAGSFAGISNNALIVAGGANFPDGGAPWAGSKKAWTDKIFVLDKPNGKWKQVAKLGQPLGYGISITYKNELLCIGGSNADGHAASMFGINYYPNGKVEFEVWPDLPEKLANACGAVVGHTLYIAGGLLTPDAKSTASVFWSIDLDSQNPKWKKLDAWPGPPRMLSVAGSLNGSFYLFSGTDLEDKNGAAHRKYLKDAYAYTPGKGWKKLTDLPSAVVAAAGPALAYGKNQLLIFGGDDGVLADNAATLKEKHPGFSDVILSYQTKTNKWKVVGHIKTHKLADAAENPNKSQWAPVTTTSVLWHNSLVFPGGEVRPAVRTPRVLVAHIKSSPLK